MIRVHLSGYELPDFKQTYSASIEGFNTGTLAGRYWNPLTLIRWAITNLIMIFLRDHCAAQIFILLAISVIFQILLLCSKPMADKWDHRMAVMIEASISIYLYALLSLTDFMGENTLRKELGLALAILTGIVIVTNVLIFLWKILCKAIHFIKLII